jgi:capsular polysaccharide transport system permease protein
VTPGGRLPSAAPSAAAALGAGPGGLREAFRIQRTVVGALLLREMSSRFGRENLGFAWLFLEPALLGGTIGLVHHLSGHGLPGGLNIPVFWVLGYVPYYMLRSIVNRGPGVVPQNQGLLYHRRITPLDLLLARDLLEGAAVMGAMAVFVVFFGLTMDVWPVSVPHVMLGMLLMWGLVHGVAVLLTSPQEGVQVDF